MRDEKWGCEVGKLKIGCPTTRRLCETWDHEQKTTDWQLLQKSLTGGIPYFDFPRFFRATFAACFPSAVRTDFGKWAIVRFFFAAAAAFLMFRLAAFRCFVLAIEPPECPIDAAHMPAGRQQNSACHPEISPCHPERSEGPMHFVCSVEALAVR